MLKPSISTVKCAILTACGLLFHLSGLAQSEKITSALCKKNNIGAIRSSSVTITDGLISSSVSTITALDQEGRTTEQIFMKVGEKKADIYKYTYKCDETATADEYEISEGIETVKRYQRSFFDDECKLIKVIWKDTAKRVTETQVITYDKAGKKIKEVTTDKDNNVTAIENYKYFDNVTDATGSFGDKSFWYHNQEYRDSLGNITKTVSIEKDGEGVK